METLQQLRDALRKLENDSKLGDILKDLERLAKKTAEIEQEKARLLPRKQQREAEIMKEKHELEQKITAVEAQERAAVNDNQPSHRQAA